MGNSGTTNVITSHTEEESNRISKLFQNASTIRERNKDILFYDKEFFEIDKDTTFFSDSQVMVLVSAYFRIYDVYGQNPIDIIKIVAKFYGGKNAIISCKSEHKPKLCLINKPIAIDITNHNNIDTKNLIVKCAFKYCKNECNHKWSKYSSRNGIGLIKIEFKEDNSIKNIEFKDFLNDICKNCDKFANLPPIHVTSKYDCHANVISKIGIHHVRDSFKNSFYKFYDSKTARLFGICVGDTIEMIIGEMNEITNKPTIVYRLVNSFGKCKYIIEKELKLNGIYIPAIVVNGCNCMKNGGISYEISVVL